ncbi:MAG: site-specific integrase [Pirellulales bacterium]|nr:site-specific integrase [Pirellulales bacterium]
MASLIYTKGTARIEYKNQGGRRSTLRLGKMPKANAKQALTHIESLIGAKQSGTTIPAVTAAWLKDVGSQLRGKLAAHDLVPGLKSAKLDDYLTAEIAARRDYSANTTRNAKMFQAAIVGYFGNCDLREITESSAADWKQSMVNNEYSPATISKWIVLARQWFKVALRKKLVDENPFADAKAGSQSNSQRLVFVDRATIQKVIDACPNTEWRLMLALSRYGALRVPSELRNLKWTDVNWEANTLTFDSQKTAKCGKPYRTIPLFPELRPYLDEAYEQASEGALFVFGDELRLGSDAVVRMRILKLLRRIGIQPWPRITHNLRASRIMELSDHFPQAVVAEWCGNSEAISQLHYQRAVTTHFDRAVSGETGLQSAITTRQSTPQNVTYNPTYSVTPNSAHVQSLAQGDMQNSREIMPVAMHGNQWTNVSVPPTGIEPAA